MPRTGNFLYVRSKLEKTWVGVNFVERLLAGMCPEAILECDVQVPATEAIRQSIIPSRQMLSHQCEVMQSRKKPDFPGTNMSHPSTCRLMVPGVSAALVLELQAEQWSLSGSILAAGVHWGKTTLAVGPPWLYELLCVCPAQSALLSMPQHYAVAVPCTLTPEFCSIHPEAS